MNNELIELNEINNINDINNINGLNDDEMVNGILITIYFLFLLTTGISILVLLNSYIENDYYRLRCDIQDLLYGINEKFDIFENKYIDTMNITKMKNIVDKINRDTINTSDDSSCESDESFDNVYSPFGPILFY